MDNDLSQLDQLSEDDILDALGEHHEEISDEVHDIEDTFDENILIEDFIDEPKVENKQEKKDTSEPCEISTTTSTDLASLLSQLLNNKTIEITIKIKD